MFTLSLSVLIQILHIIQISKVDINKKTTFNTFFFYTKNWFYLLLSLKE